MTAELADAQSTTDEHSDASATTHPQDGDARCPEGFTVCGEGTAARCYDLRQSADHCGQCNHACAPGIACQSGQCQQYRCKGAPTFKTLAAVPTHPAIADYSSVPLCAFVPALGDFDGDGNLDFVGQTGLSKPMGVMLGHGDGTFQARPLVQGFSSAWSAAAADINNDGRLDLATITRGEATVTVRLGNGDVSSLFGSAATYPTPSAPGGLVLADLDNDGSLDVVTAQSQRLTLRRGVGDGRFGDAVDLPVSLASLNVATDDPISSEYFLRATDWNRDGFLDLLYGTSTLRMLLGRGDGTFEKEVSCGLALDVYNPSDNVIADFDHDAKLDLLVGTRLAAGLTLFLAMNGCNFSTSATPPASLLGAHYLAVADLNGDGNSDVIVATWDYAGPVGTRIYLLYLGDGNGKLAPALRFPADTTWPLGNLLIGDLDHDGKLDVIVTDPGGWQVLLNTCR